MLKILHSARWNLGGDFDCPTPAQAPERYFEFLQLPSRIAAIAAREKADLAILCGDFTAGENTPHAAEDALAEGLSHFPCPVVLIPGEKDRKSAFLTCLQSLPQVYVFSDSRPECIRFPQLGADVYGAAADGRPVSDVLENFRVREHGKQLQILCLCAPGEPEKAAAFIPERIVKTGLNLLALGNVQGDAAPSLEQAGQCFITRCGAPEGHGFDSCGEKFVSLLCLEKDSCRMTQIPSAFRKYEEVEVTVKGEDGDDLCASALAALPEDAVRSIVRVILRGDWARGPKIGMIEALLREHVYDLELRDERRLPEMLRGLAGEPSLSGAFLREMRRLQENAETDEECRRIARAACRGFAALQQRAKSGGGEERQ